MKHLVFFFALLAGCSSSQEDVREKAKEMMKTALHTDKPIHVKAMNKGLSSARLFLATCEHSHYVVRFIPSAPKNPALQGRDVRRALTH